MRKDVPFDNDKSNVVAELVVFEVPPACKKAHRICFFADYRILFFDGKMKSFFDLLLDILTARLDQSHDRFFIIAVKEIVDNLGSPCVPVKDDGVIGQIKPRVACARVFYKIVEDIGKITDDRSREGYHTDDDDRETGQGQRNARGTYICYDRLYTTGVKDHGHRIISGVEEIHFLGSLQRKRTDQHSGKSDKDHVEQDDQDQYHAFRVLRDLDA